MKALFASLLFGSALAAACAPTVKETPIADSGDQCGAAQHQYLIGKKKSDIPAAPAGARWRVTCTACPVTMDFSPLRLNIFYDEKTEIIEVVKCG